MAALTITDVLAPNTGYAVTLNSVTLAQDDTLDLTNIKDNNFVVLVQNSTTNPGTVTVSAGIGSESSLGDLAVAVPASGNVAFTMEGARFKDIDGDVTVNVTGTGFAGTIAAVELPY